MGDGRIFLKSRRYASFHKDLWMSLISTGSISLDSTFKNFSRGKLESRGVHGKKIIPVLSLYNEGTYTVVLFIYLYFVSGMLHSAIIIIDTIHESWPLPCHCTVPLKGFSLKVTVFEQAGSRTFSGFPWNLKSMKIVLFQFFWRLLAEHAVLDGQASVLKFKTSLLHGYVQLINIMSNTSSQQLRGQILCPWLGDIVNYGIGLSTTSPSKGQRTRPLVMCCGLQVRCCRAEAGESSALCPAHRPHLPATCRPRPWGPSQFPIGIFPFICSLRMLAYCNNTFPEHYPEKSFF